MAAEAHEDLAKRITLFDLGRGPSLAEAVLLAEKAARLGRLAVGGLMRQAEHTEINDDDLNLLEDCLYAAELYAVDARNLLPTEGTPASASPGPVAPDLSGGATATPPMKGA